MDKTAAKFLLPSPNFGKTPIEAASKSTLHYLTPCGMTLLPRTKQPPPMYGARGATVPAKFLLQRQEQQQQQQVVHQQNETTSRVPEPEPEPEPMQYCDTCEMELQSVNDLQRHIQQHESCPIADCKYIGHPNVMDKHIATMHKTSLYTVVKKMSTPEEIAAWREQRRKRFPTVANVEQRARAKEQRQRRGERLEGKKSRFGNIEDRKRLHQKSGGNTGDNTKRKNDAHDNHSNKRNRRQAESQGKNKSNEGQKEATRKPQSEKQKQRAQYIDRNLLNKEHDECSEGITKFKGTGNMTDYKHFKTKPTAKATNALSGLLGMYGSDDDDDDDDNDEMESDDVEMDSVKTIGIPQNTIQIEETDIKITVEVKEKAEKQANEPKETNTLAGNSTNDTGKVAMQLQNTTEEAEQPSNESKETESKELTVSSAIETIPAAISNESSDEAPEEAPIMRIVEPTVITNSIQTASVTEAATTSKSEKKAAVKVACPRKKRQSGLDYRKSRLRKQNTMLEKLLENDIRHERNVLLQCVRFVCEQNYFGIGQTLKNNT